MTHMIRFRSLCAEGQFTATVGSDRSIKLWSVEEDVEDGGME